MKTLLLAAVAVLALAGCTPEERAQQRSYINEHLPAGCKFRDLGKYGNTNVNVVICDGTKSVTLNQSWLSGKYRKHATIVTLG